MKIKPLLFSVAAAFGTLFTSHSFALGMVTRACNWSEIPWVLPVFAHVGASLGTKSAADWEKIVKDTKNYHKYWTLESITTDYVEARYYLYATAAAYRANSGDGYSRVGYFRSNGWEARALDSRLTLHEKLRVFFANRTVLYSSRAGHSDMIQKFSPVPGRGSNRDYIFVVGNHWYFDVQSGRRFYLGKSKADSCNLAQWGIEER